MRHPSLILAATLLLSVRAFAINPPAKTAPGTSPLNLPHWTAQEEPWGTWRVVNFVDDSGAGHELWCRWSECSRDKRSGTAKLYMFVRKGSVQYNYKEHIWSSASTSSKTTYDTLLSKFTLDLSGDRHKAVVAGTALSFPVEDHAQLTPTGYILIVNAPKAVADDLPKKPRAGAALSGDEKYWLAKTELDAYTHDAANAPDEEKLLAVESRTRHAVALHLPHFARAPYAALIKLPIDAKKVSAYLDGLIAIRKPEELQKLSEIKKGVGVGASLQRSNALEEYQGAMATVRMGDDGRPLPGPNRDHAVEKVAEFRGMLAGHGGAKPRTRPSGDHSSVVLNLVAAEMDWLTPIERTAFVARAKAVAKGTNSAKLKVYNTARDRVEKNLRPEGLSQYQAARAEMEPVAINAALQGVKHYSGAEIELAPAEVDALAAITKAKVPTLQLGDAKVDYKREMAHIQIVNGEAVKPSEHLVAHEIAVRYRKMLADAGIKVPGAPDAGVPASTAPVVGAAPGSKPGDAANTDTGKAPLTDDQLKKLTPEEKAAYLKEVADAKGDPAKLAAVNEKYRKLLAIRDNDTFITLSPTQQKDVCAPYKNAVINGGGASVATAACAPEEKAQKVLACAKDKDCISRVAAECDPSPAKKPDAPASSIPPITDPAVKAACASLNAQPDNTTTDPGKKPAVVGDVPAAACGGTAGANPGAKAGTDKECGGAAAKKPDPNLYRNIATGMSFGMFGLILGSFFGGPLVMLAGAAIIGGAAYATSKYLNTPKKKE